MNASALLILLRLVVGSEALSNYTYSFVLETLSYLGSVTNTFNEPDNRNNWCQANAVIVTITIHSLSYPTSTFLLA